MAEPLTRIKRRTTDAEGPRASPLLVPKSMPTYRLITSGQEERAFSRVSWWVGYGGMRDLPGALGGNR
jgi:hypothetical protein